MKAPEDEGGMPSSWTGLKGYLSSKAAHLTRSAPSQAGTPWSEEPPLAETLSASWRNIKSKWASMSSSGATTPGKEEKTLDGVHDNSSHDNGTTPTSTSTFRRLSSSGSSSRPSSGSSTLFRQYSEGTPASQAIVSQSSFLPEDGLPHAAPPSEVHETPKRPLSGEHQPKTQAEPSTGVSTPTTSSAPVTWSSVRSSVPPPDPCARPKSPVMPANSSTFKTRGRRLNFGKGEGGEDGDTSTDLTLSMSGDHGSITEVRSHQGGKKGKRKKKKKVTMATIASPASVVSGLGGL